MSSIYGTIDAARAGLITFMPEGKAEEQLDAISTDVIEQGKIIFRDLGNATPALRKWKVAPTADGPLPGTVPIGISTKAKVAGELKVVGIWGGPYEATIVADDAIDPDGIVTFSTTNAGNVIAAAPGSPGIGRYLRRYKYANDGDGNHQKVACEAGDIIVIRLWS